MEDDQTTTEPAETPAETTETAEGTETAQTEETTEEKPGLTLEQAIAEVEQTRREAANYRTRLREAEAKLADAKTPEDIEAAVQEFRDKNAALERDLIVTKVVSKYGLPDALAARLQGTDEATLDADAKALAALVIAPKSTPESLSGGLTPGEGDEEFDPVAVAHAAKARRY